MIMKKTLCLLFALIPLLVYSQSEFPLIKEDAVWREGRNFLGDALNPPAYYRYQFIIQDDTVRYGKTYKKLYQTNYDSVITTKTYAGAIREDMQSRIYFLKDSALPDHLFNSIVDTVEIMLYDFNMKPGDTIYTPDKITHDTMQVVSGIDSVLINGKYRKRIQLESVEFSSRLMFWIEGIGCTEGLLSPLLYKHNSELMLNCYEDPSVFWANPQLTVDCFKVSITESKQVTSLVMFPNPASDALTISSRDEVMRYVEIFNLAGQRVLKNETPGKEVTIDVSHWNQGLYIVRIATEQGQAADKFIVR